jgi:hypothetical protein
LYADRTSELDEIFGSVVTVAQVRTDTSAVANR